MLELNIYYPTGLINSEQNITISRWGICAVIAAELLLVVILRLITVISYERYKTEQRNKYENKKVESSGKDMEGKGESGLFGKIESGVDLKQKYEGCEKERKENEEEKKEDVAKLIQLKNKNKLNLRKLRTKIKVVNLLQCREERLARREANKRKEKLEQMKKEQEQKEEHSTEQIVKTDIKKANEELRTINIHTIPESMTEEEQSNEFNSDEESSEEESSSSEESETTEPANHTTVSNNTHRSHHTRSRTNNKFRKTHEKLFYPYINIKHLFLTFHDFNTVLNLLFSHSFITFLLLLMYYPFVMGLGLAIGHFGIILSMMIMGLCWGNCWARVVVMRLCFMVVFIGNLAGIGIAIFGVLRSNPEYFGNMYQM